MLRLYRETRLRCALCVLLVRNETRSTGNERYRVRCMLYSLAPIHVCDGGRLASASVSVFSTCAVEKSKESGQKYLHKKTATLP